MLGLSYPGGPVIEKLAREGDAAKIKFPVAKISDGRPDFSFSGLKTAVSRYIRENSIVPAGENETPNQANKDIAASFQATVVKSLMTNVEKLAEKLQPKTLIVAGGVACNLALREAAEKFGEKMSLPVYFPSKHLSTDNAAMIAAAGYFHLKQGEKSDLQMTADVTLRLQNFENEDADLKRKKVRYRL
jgi:N6-L-threonylcarbamoyladenine synthase